MARSFKEDRNPILSLLIMYFLSACALRISLFGNRSFVIFGRVSLPEILPFFLTTDLGFNVILSVSTNGGNLFFYIPSVKTKNVCVIIKSYHEELRSLFISSRFFGLMGFEIETA
jgi:hypothetical protein